MKKLRPIIGLVLLLGLTFGLSNVNAQSNGLGITPRRDYSIKAGESTTDSLYVNNLSKTEPLNLSIRVIDFGAADETGTPQLFQKPNAPQTAWSLRPYISIPGQVTIAAGKSTNIPITIAIPSGLGAGSYYSAIEYSAVTNGPEQQVNLAASSTTLIFVKIPGTARELLTLRTFGAFIPTSDGSSGRYIHAFLTSTPEVLSYRLTNSGNIAEQPTGSVIIKNIFGKQARLIEAVNPKKELALLGQTRRFDVCIKSGSRTIKGTNGQDINEEICTNPKLLPGRYSAEMTLLYGENGNNTQQIIARTSFWYLPLWFVVAALVVLVCLVGSVWWLVRKLARRRHRKRS